MKLPEREDRRHHALADADDTGLASDAAMTSSSFAREYLSGSLASSFTYGIFAPLETIKTRMQLQDAPGYVRTYRHWMLPALRTVYMQDGLLRFWSHGLAAGVCRDFCYSGIRTGMYPTVRDAIAAATRGGTPTGGT